MEAVLIALITTGPPTLMALAAWRSSNAARTIVQGNGRGDVVKMVKDVQDTLDTHGTKIDSVLTWQGAHEADHARAAARATSN